MLMLLRLLSVSLLATLALAQGTQAPQESSRTGTAPPPAFWHEFGQAGEDGSFRVRFNPLGGGIVSVQTMDHFVSRVEARHDQHTPEDYLLLAWNGSDHALRLSGTPQGSQFPQPLWQTEWQVATTPDSVTFTLDSGNGLTLRRTLRHDPKNRGFVLEIGLRKTAGDAVGQVAFELTGPALVQESAQLIGNQTFAIVGLPEGNNAHLATLAGQVQTFEVDVRSMTFAGVTNRFFGAFLDPRNDVARNALASLLVDTVPPTTSAEQKANTATRMRYGMALPVPAVDQETVAQFGLYLGPKSFRVFETLEAPERYLPILDVDLNPPCCVIDIPGGRFMAKSLLRLLGVFHDWVGNWGLAIIMLTILVRGSMAPLNYRMQKSMRAYSAKMAVLKPKMDALKKQFGDDQRAYQQAMIGFQREHKLMPPLGGCLPIFLTMPIYIGLFTALRTAYDVRQQGFVGWIDDLSRPDALFDLPFFPYHFNLLPLLWMACFVYLQTRTPLPTDPQQRQMMSIMRWMPIMFGVMLYSYASALMLYMVTSMLWSMVETHMMRKILGPVDPNVAAMTPTMM